MSKAQPTPKDAPANNPDAVYLPGAAHDEMFAKGGFTRPHYQLLQRDIDALGAQALADRQRTLERSFLLQGITFTVYGARQRHRADHPHRPLPAHHPGRRMGQDRGGPDPAAARR